MDRLNFYLRYSMLGMVAALVWTAHASALLDIISAFVFSVCFAVVLLLSLCSALRIIPSPEESALNPAVGLPEHAAQPAPPRKHDYRRYLPQMMSHRIRGRGQRALASSSIAIVGLGQTGRAVAEAWCRAGIGSLLLFDPKAEEHRTMHFSEELSEINSEVDIRTHSISLSEQNVLLLESGLILDCTGSAEARRLIDAFCREMQIPWIIVNTTRSGCQVKLVSDLKPLEKHLLPHRRPAENIACIAAALSLPVGMRLFLGKNSCTDLITYENLAISRMNTERISPKTAFK